MIVDLTRNPQPGWIGSRTSLGLEGIVGESRAIQEAVELARRVAPRRDAPVLIVGETGTGKELFARGIHHAGSEAGEPFVPVNCSGLPSSLLESELVGHEASAFPEARGAKPGLLEMAGRGTLFLDEVGELPLQLQSRLLRVLDTRRSRRVGGGVDREIRCRILASSSRPLEELVAQGRFRADLFHRLAVFQVSIPPLRERGSDLELLARHFLNAIGEEERRSPRRLSIPALEALYRHRWPGNVRELKHTLERASFLAPSPIMDAEHLTIQVRWNRPMAGQETEGGWEVAEAIRIPPEGKALEDIEKEAVQATLTLTRGNQSAAARILGISRPTLSRKIRRYGLRVRRGSRA